ncbi:hypothetical protein DH86_00000591 [Scytalidium sp. 3C]|nr:hypothetical protein DH86_00000591 [Scytalidium sp. 3C]
MSTRFERLLHIGTTSTVLGPEALKTALAEAQEGRDVRRYIEARQCLEHVEGGELDSEDAARAWVENTEKKNRAETARLEAELSGYKNNLIKESIRMGNEDLGKHYQSIGDLPHAAEAFGRMRQDISVARHIVDVSKYLIEIGIEQRNWFSVTSNVQKIKSVPSTDEEEKAIQPYLCAADGLAHLYMQDYQQAARDFLNTGVGMGSSCNTMISPNDVAVYGGLCALATMNRNELSSRVLENANFRTYLELEPHIRRAISSFVNGRYSACLSILESYRADYLLDIHLADHVDYLYQLVRAKSIVQYFIPFSCVSLDTLEQTFGVPGKNLDEELVSMIRSGQLDARVDTQDRQSSLTTSRRYEKEARLRIQHMNIVSADLEIKGGKRNQAAGQPFGDLPWGAEGLRPGGRDLRGRQVPGGFA